MPAVTTPMLQLAVMPSLTSRLFSFILPGLTCRLATLRRAV
jgi:hypothetical protein